ncbi:unnamed protein product [Penicillium glandicola]
MQANKRIKLSSVSTEKEESTTVHFDNDAEVGNQAGRQTFYGPVFFGNNACPSCQTLLNSYDNSGLELCKWHTGPNLEILGWLAKATFESRNSYHLEKLIEGTGKWFLDSLPFNDWVRGNQPILLCPGDPGAGKTMISALVIDHLRTIFEDCPDIGVSFIYFDYKVRYESPTEILAALVRQFIQQKPSMPDYVHELYARSLRLNRRPTLKELSFVMRQLLSHHARSFLVIDALDECPSSNGTRRAFLSEILSHSTETELRVMITTRYSPEISRDLEHAGAVELNISATGEDVNRYIDSRIQRTDGVLFRNLQVQEDIKAQVTKAVGGIFLLAQLYLDHLTDMREPRDVKEILQRLPESTEAYSHAYSTAMSRIEGQGKGTETLAKKALSWVACSTRPLRTAELQHAVAIRTGDSAISENYIPMTEDILSVCAGLLIEDKHSETIRFVHFTTQQYFEETWARWFPDAHSNITGLCITYLSFDAFKSRVCQTDCELETRLKTHSLYAYAAKHWGNHARLASPNIHSEICLFLNCQGNIDCCSQAMLNCGTADGYSQRSVIGLKGVHLAAYFGLHEVLESLIQSDGDLNARDEKGQTPLWWAASNGHVTTIKFLLLRKGTDVSCGGENHRCPLSQAALQGHTKAVELLLADDRVDPNIKDADGQTPLSLAAWQGHEKIVALLLARIEVNPDMSDLWGATPLSYGMPHDKVVDLLLQTQRVDVNSKTKFGWAPLAKAADEGYVSSVELILSKATIEVDIDNLPNDLCDFDEETGQTPLSLAASKGHTAVMELLLRTNGVNIEKKDIFGDTALAWAAKKGQTGAISILLQHHANPNPQNSFGQTPLHLAAVGQHDEVVELLLQTRHVDSFARDFLGRSPVLMATETQNSVVSASPLQGSGIPNGNPSDELIAHTSEEALQIVRRLLISGSPNLNLLDANGDSTGSWATQKRFEDVMDILIWKGMETNQCRYDGLLMVSLAADKAWEAVVEILLATGANLNLKDSSDRTFLKVGVEQGDHDIVGSLSLDDSASENVTRLDKQTEMSVVPERGYGNILKILHEEGFDLDHVELFRVMVFSFIRSYLHARLSPMKRRHSI